MWVKLYYKFLKWEWYSDINVSRLFLHLLLTANWEDGKFKGIEIPRGSLITGRKKLSKETGLSEQEIRTALTKLKSTNEITIKTTSKYSIISIQNYDIYQQNDQQPSQVATKYQPSSNHNHRYIDIQNNKLNEFNLYNNFSENLKCDCICKSTKTKCLRRSSFNIDGKNYCNQHARELIPDLKIDDKTKFKKPTVEEVQDYVDEKSLNVSAESFIDYYNANGWKIGKNSMKDWKATVRNWNRRQFETNNQRKTAGERWEETKRRFLEGD